MKIANRRSQTWVHLRLKTFNFVKFLKQLHIHQDIKEDEAQIN